MEPSLEDTVSLRTAFVIMQRYLESYRKHTSGDVEVGALLSDVQMLQDGSTADPAALGDWLAVAEAVIGGRQGALFMQFTPKP